MVVCDVVLIHDLSMMELENIASKWERFGRGWFMSMSETELKNTKKRKVPISALRNSLLSIEPREQAVGNWVLVQTQKSLQRTLRMHP